MNTHPGLETAGAYLHVQLGHSGSPWLSRKTEGPFITLSRESGSGGSSLARTLAMLLNTPASPSKWTIFTGNIIEEMLQANQLPSHLARFLPEDRISEITASVGELVGLHPNLWDLVQKTNECMRRLARSGCVILVGRGANFATRGIEHGVHIRLVAPSDHRARQIARLKEMEEADACAYNAGRDLARERYVRTHFNANIKDPTAYDLVIDSSRVQLTEATNLVASLMRARTPTVSPTA